MSIPLPTPLHTPLSKLLHSMTPIPPIFRILPFLASAALAADVSLSPAGPMFTPQAARDAARSLPKPVRVIVAEGTYALTEPLMLDAQDSGVHWEAAAGARPTFEGGRAITGWVAQKDGLWKAPVPEARAGKWDFEQLWVNGKRATRARTPNIGFFHMFDEADPATFPGIADLSARAFVARPAEYAVLQAIPQAERDGVLLSATQIWSVGQCRIEKLDDATQSVLIKGRARYPFVENEPDQRWFVENFKAALDAPGEWYLDKQEGALYYRPRAGEDMGKAEVIAPVTERFLVIAGAKDVRFSGLRFVHADHRIPATGLHDGQAASLIDGAIEIEKATGIHFSDCEVAHLGKYAIYFKNATADCSVTHCHLHDLGAGGVRIGEIKMPEHRDVTQRITVDDCIIQHGGRMFASACGVFLAHAKQCAVTHCDIGDFYYSGVSAGWQWGYKESASRENRVENNHIHHLGWGYISDMGGFYGLSTAPGSVVSGNHIHHIAGFRYGGWGLYNDEGTTDMLMEKNLIHDTSNASFHQHYGYYNTIRNNIFAFGRTAAIYRTRNESRLSLICERNIAIWEPTSKMLDGSEAAWKLNENPAKGDPKDTAIFRKNLYWQTDGAKPVAIAKKWSWEEWLKMGRDAGSIFADPLFVDLAKRDFRLKPGSPAEKIGFEPWDLTLAGVRRDGPNGAAWRELAGKGAIFPNWEQDSKPWPAPEFSIPLQTFERTSLGALGIRNGYVDAEGKGDSIGVSEDAASPFGVKPGDTGQRSLKVQDAPGLSKSYKPVLMVLSKWERGTVRASFDVMSQPGAEWYFELRPAPHEHGVGPLVWCRNGQFVGGKSGEKKLATIPAGEWCRLQVIASIGSGTFDVVITQQNGTRQEFKDIPCKAGWEPCATLLWSATSGKQTAYFIDNLTLERGDGSKQ